MKKIININLSGRVIPIEDAAYESLQRYIESLRRYFANEEGRDEIINDIESRIAELMSDIIKKGSNAVTEQDMEEIINSMGRVEDFEQSDAEEKAAGSTDQSADTNTYAEPKRKKGRLYRDASDKFLGGVCSGIANYMNVDPAIVRLLFAIITFGGFGMGILIYILLWIILPIRNLDTYVGKRLFRNPDDKVISGVAGGLAAYFDKPSALFRLVFAAPLVLNILFGILNGIFFMWERDIFPNIFIGSFSGTFILAYIILWIVLPEARSPFEKMEMRGETVDVNRIRQNVKEGMGDFKNKMQSWGSEVKSSAQQLGSKASEFASTRGKTFASEVSDTARPAASGCLHAVGVIIKAFFIFVAGCIALSLFAAFLAILFGGAAWWPINNFLWTSSTQKVLAWGTLIFFLGVPIIGFITWLVRRLLRARSRSRYLGWIFGGLWTAGWLFAIFFAVSMAKDFREYERVAEPEMRYAGQKITVRVNEPVIRYSGGFGWIRSDNTGWDITNDSMKYNNVKLRIEKSEDSLYHITVLKYSFGNNIKDAQNRAQKIIFHASTQDSLVNIGSGLGIDRTSKSRGQGVIVEIKIPVGRHIRFDESLEHAYNPWVVRRNDGRREWNRRFSYEAEWDWDYSFDFRTDIDYVMTTDGKLAKVGDVITTQQGTFPKQTNADSLKQSIQQRSQQIEDERRRLEEDREKLRKLEQQKRDSNSTGFTKPKTRNNGLASSHASFVPMII